jgi:RHS repeat-associated protein
MSRRMKSVPATLLAILLPAMMFAQQHPNIQRGFAPDKVYQFGSVESVSVYNGNVNVSIPLGDSYPVGGGFSYSLTLSYNSKAWDYIEQLSSFPDDPKSYTEAFPNLRSNAGMGWSVSLGSLIPPGDASNGGGSGLDWIFETGDGAEHRFFASSNANVEHSRDGSYLRMTRSSLQISPNTFVTIREIESPDGIIHRFHEEGELWRLREIRDRFNNKLSIEYPVTDASTDLRDWLISDTHGRSQRIRFRNEPNVGQLNYQKLIDRVELTGFGGSTSSYQFFYTIASVDRGANASMIGDGSKPIAVPILTSVVLPDGSSYSMDLHRTSAESGEGGQGMISHLTLPTRGKIEWLYQPYPLFDDLCGAPHITKSPGVRSKTHRDAGGAIIARWEYTVSTSDPINSGEVCFDPDSGVNIPRFSPEYLSNTITISAVPVSGSALSVTSKTTHFFSVWPEAPNSPRGYNETDYGLPLMREIDMNGVTNPIGSATGETLFLSSQTCDPLLAGCVPLRSTFVKYEDVGEVGGHGPQKRPKIERTVFHDDADHFIESASSDFDTFGHYRQSLQSSSFGTTRRTRRNFNPGIVFPNAEPWILNTYTEDVTTEGTQSAKTLYCFDSATAFLKGRRVLANGSFASEKDLLTLLTPDGNGNVAAERFFGGDRSLLTTTDACSEMGDGEYRVDHTWSFGSLASSQWRGVSWKSADHDIDPSTGLPSASRDPAGVLTGLLYDTSGRLASVRPSAGNGAWMSYSYTNASPTVPASVTVAETANGSTTSELRRTSFEFDAFGRLEREKRLVPTAAAPAGEQVSRLTRYNGIGWKTAVSEWQSGTPTKFTTFSDFDAFGRAMRVSPPSSVAGSHDVTMQYRGAREIRRTTRIGMSGSSAALTPSTNVEQYDSSGRLVRVIESLTCRTGATPCPDTELGPVTEYSYDVFGNLARVCGDAATGGCTQLRLFTYDGRGFLLSERTPERGVNGNATTEYSLYDSRGNAGRKLTGAVDGPFDLRTAYDSLGRPLSLSSHGGTRVVKEWLYDVHPNGYSRSGAMVRSIRRNNDGAFAGDFVVSEHVQYEGGAGRISRIDTDIAHATAGSRSLFQTWRWTDLGNADEQLYPFFSGMPLLETKNDYTGGVLTRVRNKSGGDYASSIRYHANGLTHEVGHANGMTETIAADSSGMARPKSISFSGASAWSSGDYSYDGAGNVTAIGNTRYAYDSANRLRGWYETFTGGHASHYLGYDLFGNKYDLGFERCGSDPGSGMMHCMQTSVAVPVINAATNHFAGMSHDADGNFIANGTYSYQYDGTSMMTGMSTGSRDFRYVYTADDERIGTYDVSAQTWVWKLRDIGGKPLREFTSSGGTLGFANWSWAKDYVYRGNTILASITPSETQHFHPDHLGTPRLITGASGAQRGRHDYTPFGIETTPTQQNNQLLKFTSHERDHNGPAGSEDRDYLDYMHARYYNPNLGRFLSIDPALDTKKASTNPQMWNRYAYVSNNPMNRIDPDGRCEQAPNSPPCSDLTIQVRAPNVSNWEHIQFIVEETSAELTPFGFVGIGTPEGLWQSYQARQNPEPPAVLGGTVILGPIGSPTGPYVRPSGATTPQQRASVQGKPCSVCGVNDGGKRVAGHKEALVQEHYRTGTIDKAKMRDVNSVRPECPTCSAKEGAQMSRFSRWMKDWFGF